MWPWQWRAPPSSATRFMCALICPSLGWRLSVMWPWQWRAPPSSATKFLSAPSVPQEEAFCDVTLALEGSTLKSHKVYVCPDLSPGGGVLWCDPGSGGLHPQVPHVSCVSPYVLQVEAFCDVTLAVEGSTLKCHKVILAASSMYFQSIFMENTCKHPIVFLKVRFILFFLCEVFLFFILPYQYRTVSSAWYPPWW